MIKYLNIILVLLITACGKSTPPPQQSVTIVNPPSDEASVKLAEAAGSISRSLNELAYIKAASTPIINDDLLSPYHTGLQNKTNIDWTGPIEQLVAKIAEVSEYDFKIIGKPPTIEIMVLVSIHNATLGDILRDLDWQAGNKAFISVDSDNMVIELQYV